MRTGREGLKFDYSLTVLDGDCTCIKGISETVRMGEIGIAGNCSGLRWGITYLCTSESELELACLELDVVSLCMLVLFRGESLLLHTGFGSSSGKVLKGRSMLR